MPARGIDDRKLGERTLAIIRLALLPVMLAAERLNHSHELAHNTFEITLALAALYAVGAWALVFAGRVAVPGWMFATVDLLLLATLTYETGGVDSGLRQAFVLVPVAAVFLMRPRLTALWSCLAVLAYLGVLFAHPATDTPAEVRRIVGYSLYIAWTGAVATFLSVVFARRRQQMEELATRGSRLAAQVVDTEQRERRRLADALHEGALQAALAARQDVVAAEAGDSSGLAPARVALDATIDRLRHEVFHLYPRVLDEAGLAAALNLIAHDEARRSGFSVAVTVDEEAADIDDQLVFSLTRELLTNAAKHARAENVLIALRRLPSAIVVEVHDDGRGFSEKHRQAALRQGHIGLPSLLERVEALGGSSHLLTQLDLGTHIRLELPIRRERRRVSRPQVLPETASNVLVKLPPAAAQASRRA
jgi:two-component system NarL family sensor kinase